MTRRSVETSPQVYARVAGALYLIIIAVGLFAEVVRQRLVVHGDAVATAQNILAHELLYRWSFAAGIIVLVCAIPVAVILCELLQPVNRSLTVLAVFFNLVSIAIEAGNLLNHFAPLILLKGGSVSSPAPAEPLQALAYASLRLQSVGYAVSLTFFALFCVLIGYLIFRSTFLPRILGVLMAVAGVCYAINSFAIFLAPALADRLFPYILVPCFVAELALALWLTVIGVNVPRWEQERTGN